MSELNNKYNKILNDIEKQLKDKQDLDFVKGKFTELSVLFIDIIDRLTSLTDIRIKEIENSQKQIEDKISKVQNVVDGIENDIYSDDNYEFEIICPYCNYEFVTDIDTELKDEVECPECRNVIELDWNNEEGNNCAAQGCSHCKENCVNEEEEQYKVEDKKPEDNEDDM